MPWPMLTRPMFPSDTPKLKNNSQVTNWKFHLLEFIFPGHSCIDEPVLMHLISKSMSCNLNAAKTFNLFDIDESLALFYI